MPSSYRLVVIDSLEKWDAISNDWNALLRRSSADSFFLSFEWLRAWVSLYWNSSDRLWILAVYKENSLIGYAPWRIAEIGQWPCKIRQIEFLGTKETSSDYLDVVARKGREASVTSLIYDYLFGVGKHLWSSLLLSDIRSDSRFLTHFIERLDGDGKWFQISPREFCPVLEIPKSQQDLYQQLSSERRRRFFRNREKLESEPNFELQSIVIQDQNAQTQALTELFELYQGRWGDRSKLLKFLLTYQALPTQTGVLEIELCRINGRLVGGILNVREPRRLSLYTAAVDATETPDSQVLPVLLSRIFEREIENGTQYYDFLKGTEHYKLFWATSGIRTLNLTIINSRSRAMLIFARDAIKNFLKLLVR